MRKEKALIGLLRSLVDLLTEESTRNPEPSRKLIPCYQSLKGRIKHKSTASMHLFQRRGKHTQTKIRCATGVAR